ncbi:MAG: VTT domain-containing protein [Planctomycetota bacterium]
MSRVNQDDTGERRRSARRLSRLRPWGATALAAGLPGLGLLALVAHRDAVSAWMTAQPAGIGIASTLVIGGLLCGLALMPTHAVSLASGWLLGVWVGPLTACSAVMLGVLLSYPAGRRLAGSGAADALRASPRWSGVHAALTGAEPLRSVSLVALLRLSPLAPFAATNVALAALGLRWRVFVIGSAIGLAPRVVAVAVLGAGMSELDLARPGGLAWLIAGVACTLAAIGLLGHTAGRVLRRQVSAAVDAG